MNHEVEYYPGELRELRAKVKAQTQEDTMAKEIEVATWTPIQCNHCGVNCDLFVKGTKALCRECKQDHFKEEN